MKLTLTWVHFSSLFGWVYRSSHLTLSQFQRSLTIEKIYLMPTFGYFFVLFLAGPILFLHLTLSQAQGTLDEKMTLMLTWVHFLFCWLGLHLFSHLTLSQSQGFLADKKMKLILTRVHFLFS